MAPQLDDSPQTSSQGWRLMDLWDEYNGDLMENFYQNLLKPNYKSDLDPLEFWLTYLSNEGRDNPSIGDLHVLLALKDGAGGLEAADGLTDQRHLMSPLAKSRKEKIDGGIMFLYYPDINCGLFMYFIVHQYRRNSGKGLDTLLINTAIDILEKSAIQHGHLAGCNAIFLETDPLPSSRLMPSHITDSSFLPATSFHTSGSDLLDPRHQHAILHAMGFRLVDCDYMLRRRNSSKSRLLTVYVTPKIPTMPFEEGDKYYLPSRLLHMFVERHWYSLYEISKLIRPKKALPAPKIPPASPSLRRWRTSSMGGSQDMLTLLAGDPDETPEKKEIVKALETVLSQIDVRDKIPLLDLPWGEGRLYTLVDLFEDYDEQLLEKFYRELMEPNFAPDEIEPLQNFIDALSYSARGNPYYPDLHIILALRWSQPYTPELGPAIIGGLVFEYHPSQNMGLITYFLLKSDRGSTFMFPASQHTTQAVTNVSAGYSIPVFSSSPHSAPGSPRLASYNKTADDLPTNLIEEALALLDYNAKTRGNLAGCNAIFMEAYSPLGHSRSHSRRGSDYGDFQTSTLRRIKIIDVTQEHELLWRLGFRLLNFQYVMPPFTANQKKSTRFMLTVYLPPLTSAGIPSRGDKYYLPSQALKTFIQDQWLNAFKQGHLKWDPTVDPDLLRMLKQLNLRANIGCLDLPWSSGAYTLIDIWNDYDEDLLKNFYNELMVPNFAENPEELEPLENWIRALEISTKVDPDLLDLHVLLAVKWPGSDNESQGAVIDGGCVFEYYEDINCGLLSYLVVRPRKNSEALLSILVEQVIDILNENARSAGHMSGLDVLYWEANTSDFPNNLRRKASRPMASHEFAHGMGFRQVDFTYVLPPVSPIYPQKLTNYLLTVLLTPNIPRTPFEEGQKYGLPSNVVSGFIRAIWKSAFATGRISDAPEEDKDYVKSIEQIQLRQMIPLLDLPWSVKNWTFVDLWQDHDEELLERFYKDLMIPNFPITDELEPLDLWVKLLSPEWRESIEASTDVSALVIPELHIILALRWEHGKAFIGGGIVAEYYNCTNCGILTYLVVHKKSRGQGLAGILVSRAVEVMGKNAKKRGKLAGCNAVLLETNSAEKVTPQQDVMCVFKWYGILPRAFADMTYRDPRMRHVIYHKMGFRLIDHPYIMPPLAPGKGKLKILLLTVYITPNIPRDPFRANKFYLPNQLLENFIAGQWKGAHAKGNLGCPPEQDPDYTRSIGLIDIREKIPLLDLPWTRMDKPFTIVDMWEDLDEDLVSHFYHEFVVPRFAHRGLEPLDNWLKTLTDEGRLSADVCDLHVLLAFDLNSDEDSQHVQSGPPAQNTSASHTNRLVGGLVFEYYPTTNCALITYVAVQGSGAYRASLAKFLVSKALKICDSNAKLQGHIAGCNAVFLETEFKSESDVLVPNEGVFLSSEDNGEAEAISNHQVLTRLDYIKGYSMQSSASPPQSPLLVPSPTSFPFDDPLDHHFLHQRGFRMLDFQYFQPPYDSRNPTSKNVCLTVFITDRIPKFEGDDLSHQEEHRWASFGMPAGESDELNLLQATTNPIDISDDIYDSVHRNQHFIPVALMRNFLKTLWADECGLVGYEHEKDSNYQEMMEDLDILDDRGGRVWVHDDNAVSPRAASTYSPDLFTSEAININNSEAKRVLKAENSVKDEVQWKRERVTAM